MITTFLTEPIFMSKNLFFLVRVIQLDFSWYAYSSKTKCLSLPCNFPPCIWPEQSFHPLHISMSIYVFLLSTNPCTSGSPIWDVILYNQKASWTILLCKSNRQWSHVLPDLVPHLILCLSVTKVTLQVPDLVHEEDGPLITSSNLFILKFIDLLSTLWWSVYTQPREWHY